MGTSSNLLGKTFGMLRVMHRKERPPVWVCACACGAFTEVPTSRLNSGNTKSCGCLKRSVLGDATRTHGMSNSRVKGYANRAYGVWQAMKDRCTNANRVDYKHYGGRGITVCERWESFENFYADMGAPPVGLTLDRVDNDKGYSPDNCKWVSRKEQVYNSSRVRYVSIGGETKPLRSWLKEVGVSRHAFYYRLKKGLTEQEALNRGEAK